MQFVKRETLVEEITEDGKINSIVEKKELSAYEKEQDRLKSLPEFQKIRKTAVDTERSTGDRGPEDEGSVLSLEHCFVLLLFLSTQWLSSVVKHIRLKTIEVI